MLTVEYPPLDCPRLVYKNDNIEEYTNLTEGASSIRDRDSPLIKELALHIPFDLYLWEHNDKLIGRKQINFQTFEDPDIYDYKEYWVSIDSSNNIIVNEAYYDCVLNYLFVKRIIKVHPFDSYPINNGTVLKKDDAYEWFKEIYTNHKREFHISLQSEIIKYLTKGQFRIIKGYLQHPRKL